MDIKQDGNPQTGNGFTKIANETMEALAKIRVPGQARQLLDFILRKTYGWGKKKDTISLSQFVAGTGLSKVAVCKNLKKLLDINIITKKGNASSLFTQKGNDIIPTYGFQKKYRLWVALPKKVTLPKKVIDVTQKGNQTLPKKTHTKETITKETITKEKEITSFKKNEGKEEFYLTKKKRKLKGKRLETFLKFWEAFNYKSGKAEAADSWLDIPLLNNAIMERIIEAAEAEASGRAVKKTNGNTPKMAQGWLSGRRWEDEIQQTKRYAQSIEELIV